MHIAKQQYSTAYDSLHIEVPSHSFFLFRELLSKLLWHGHIYSVDFVLKFSFSCFAANVYVGDALFMPNRLSAQAAFHKFSRCPEAWDDGGYSESYNVITH